MVHEELIPAGTATLQSDPKTFKPVKHKKVRRNIITSPSNQEPIVPILPRGPILPREPRLPRGPILPIEPIVPTGDLHPGSACRPIDAIHKDPMSKETNSKPKRHYLTPVCEIFKEFRHCWSLICPEKWAWQPVPFEGKQTTWRREILREAPRWRNTQVSDVKRDDLYAQNGQYLTYFGGF